MNWQDQQMYINQQQANLRQQDHIQMGEDGQYYYADEENGEEVEEDSQIENESEMNEQEEYDENDDNDEDYEDVSDSNDPEAVNRVCVRDNKRTGQQTNTANPNNNQHRPNQARRGNPQNQQQQPNRSGQAGPQQQQNFSQLRNQNWANSFGGNLNTGNRVINVNINGVPARGDFDLNGLVGQISGILSNHNIARCVQDSMDMAIQQADNLNQMQMGGNPHINQTFNINNEDGEYEDNDDDNDSDDDNEDDDDDEDVTFYIIFK